MRKLILVSIILLAVYTTHVSAEVGDLLTSTSYKSLDAGESWNLEEGYALTIKQINIEGNKIWLSLSKYNSEVDSKVLSNGETYVYGKEIGSKECTILRATVGEIDKESRTVRLDSVRQYSDGGVIGDRYYLAIELPERPVVGEELTIIVTSGNSPTNGASVQFAGENLGLTDSNGKVRLTLEEAGTYTVTASKEGYLTASSKITVSFPSANTPASSTTKLISPSNSVLMDNGRTDWRDNIVWDFDWSDVKGATQYQLYVIGDNVPNPMINTITSDSSYHYISQSYCSSNIGWTWKVRAKVNDQWSGWSETRSFQVEKVDTDQPIQTVTQPTPAPTSARTPATTRHTTPVATSATRTTQQSKTSNIFPTFVILGLLFVVGFVGYVLIREAPEGGWTVERLVDAVKYKYKPTPPQKPDKPTKRSHDGVESDHDLISRMDRTEELWNIQKAYESSKEAKSVIQGAEADLQDAMNKGVQIPQSIQQLLQDAQKEVDAGNFATAKEYAYKCSGKVNAVVKDLEQMRKNALGQIKSAKYSLEKAEKLGVSVQDAKELNIKAQSAFDANDYSSAISYANQSKDAAGKLIDKSKPSVSIELPPKMEYEAWKHRDLTVTNTGSAHAVAVTITFLTALEMREFEVIERLDVGEQKTINVNIKPTEKGEVPVDYWLCFK